MVTFSISFDSWSIRSAVRWYRSRPASVRSSFTTCSRSSRVGLLRPISSRRFFNAWLDSGRTVSLKNSITSVAMIPSPNTGVMIRMGRTPPADIAVISFDSAISLNAYNTATRTDIGSDSAIV